MGVCEVVVRAAASDPKRICPAKYAGAWQLTPSARASSPVASDEAAGVCCVERWDGNRITGCGARLPSEAKREFGERQTDSIMGGHVGGEFVVTAA